MKCDTKILTDAIRILTCINSDITVTPSENRWSIKLLCPSHVVLMTMKITMEGEVDGADFGLSTDDFLSVLKLMKDDDCIITRDTAQLTIKSGRITRTMTMNVASEAFPSKLLTSDGMNCHITIKTNDLVDAVNVLSSVGENYSLDYDSNMIKLVSTNDKSDSAEYDIFEGYKFNDVETGMSAKYGVEYLSNIVKRLPKDMVVTLNCSTDFPMIMEYASDKMNFAWMCAPLISSEGEN